MTADSCDHPLESREWRKWFRTMGGPPRFRIQCLKCLAGIGPKDTDPHDLRTIHEVDPGEVLLAKLPRKVRKRGAGNAKRRAYDKFMRSSPWKRQRRRVLERDRYRCKVNLEGCEFEATQAHHVRYSDPIERTPDRDIVAACASCNALEREKRITAAVLGG